jgi:hypothetical protein
MARRVWRFRVPVADATTLEMPKGAEVLTVQLQRGEPTLWAACDPEVATETRHFRWVGTGHPFDGPALYVGTVQFSGGSLVFHLFEIMGGLVNPMLRREVETTAMGGR